MEQKCCLVFAAIIAIVCNLYYFYCVKEIDKNIIVKISNGELRGYQFENIYAFESIPYAEPPIGENRFEPPQEYIRKWNEIRDAKGKSPACLQWSEFVSNNYDDHVKGQEDCLYLNIYTPAIYFDNKTSLPVIIFIHGGAFMHGSTKLLDSYLARKENNFIYINLNYRLGPLGFLSTEDEQIPGNMGLKDQHMAIKWVKKNIKAFNGDPEQIILSGFSAGAASTHYHIISKKTEGLIKVAVSHSGCALNPWALIQNPLLRTKKLAAHLNCPTENTKEMKNCLKQKDARDIVHSVEKFLIFLNNPFTVFGPVIEPKLNNKDPFLVENVETLIKNGQTSQIPWLLGYTADEGVYNAAYLLSKDKNNIEMIQYLNERWEEIAPLMLFFNESVSFDKHTEIAKYYKEKYLGHKEISKDTFWQIKNMCTDRFFIDGIQKSIELHKNYTKAPVFVYAFDYPAAINLGQIMSKRQDIYFGSGHGDDVYLMFVSNFVRKPNTFTHVEEVISSKLIKMYESFIKTGVPKYGNIAIPKNEAASNRINLLRIKGTESLIESISTLTSTN